MKYVHHNSGLQPGSNESWKFSSTMEMQIKFVEGGELNLIVYAYCRLPTGICNCRNRPLTRYVKLRVAHAPTISKETACQRCWHASRPVSHARAMMHVGIASPLWRGKRSQHIQCMRSPQFYVSDKRPIAIIATASFNKEQLIYPKVEKIWRQVYVISLGACISSYHNRIMIRIGIHLLCHSLKLHSINLPIRTRFSVLSLNLNFQITSLKPQRYTVSFYIQQEIQTQCHTRIL